MKTVITIGCEGARHDTVFGLLQQAGLQAARPGKREGLTPQALQGLMLQANDVDMSTSRLGQVKLGKLWNELATDLFVANLAQPQWGWCDPQSVVFMDFWRGFDNQVRLLLVYNAPHSFVAQRLADTTTHTQAEVDRLLAEWRLWNGRLLSYAQRYPEQTLLISSDRVVAQPQAVLPLLQTAWDLALTSQPQGDAGHAGAPLHTWCPLQAKLAMELVPAPDAAWEVYHKLQAAAALAHEPTATASPQQAWAIWRQVRLDLQHTEGRHSQDLAALQQQTEQERSQWAKEKNLLTQQAQALASENNQAQQRADALAAEHTKIKQALDTQVKQTTQREAELKTAVQAVKDNIQKEQAAWSARLAELQKALEQAKKQAADEQARLKTSQAQWQEQAKGEQARWEKEKTSLQQQCAAAKAEVQALTSQLKASQGAGQSTQALTLQLKDTQEENELLLTQLHQVQEELEQLFLKQQAAAPVPKTQAGAGFVNEFWRQHQPSEIRIDLRQPLVGQHANWYEAETDGRWAGPHSPAVLELPPLQTGRYQVELVLVDAMSPDILQGLALEAEGQTVPLHIEHPLTGHAFPLRAKATLHLTGKACQGSWPLALQFAKAVSPAASGDADTRKLALRAMTFVLYRAEKE